MKPKGMFNKNEGEMEGRRVVEKEGELLFSLHGGQRLIVSLQKRRPSGKVTFPDHVLCSNLLWRRCSLLLTTENSSGQRFPLTRTSSHGRRGQNHSEVGFGRDSSSCIRSGQRAEECENEFGEDRITVKFGRDSSSCIRSGQRAQECESEFVLRSNKPVRPWMEENGGQAAEGQDPANSP
ncbi:hypothetical protein L484_027676 [Morus notabilis]|uniref:Uncharacterized protein n=1 Tax=Morus notabilis TaxID=981085 RepID=W9RN07_9ROSA|nr:hypothetical protein L484_027676 [Morus notabilis]